MNTPRKSRGNTRHSNVFSRREYTETSPGSFHRNHLEFSTCFACFTLFLFFSSFFSPPPPAKADRFSTKFNYEFRARVVKSHVLIIDVRQPEKCCRLWMWRGKRKRRDVISLFFFFFSIENRYFYLDRAIAFLPSQRGEELSFIAIHYRNNGTVDERGNRM